MLLSYMWPELAPTMYESHVVVTWPLMRGHGEASPRPVKVYPTTTCVAFIASSFEYIIIYPLQWQINIYNVGKMLQ